MKTLKQKIYEKLVINKNFKDPLNQIDKNEYKNAEYLICFCICYDLMTIKIISVNSLDFLKDNRKNNTPQSCSQTAKINGYIVSISNKETFNTTADYYNGILFDTLYSTHYIFVPLSYIRYIKDNFKTFITKFSKNNDFTIGDFEKYINIDVSSYLNRYINISDFLNLSNDVSTDFLKLSNSVSNISTTSILNFIENFEK